MTGILYRKYTYRLRVKLRLGEDLVIQEDSYTVICIAAYSYGTSAYSFPFIESLRFKISVRQAFKRLKLELE